MSVHLMSVALAHSRTPEEVLAGHDGYSLSGISVGRIRELTLGVVRVPLEAAPEHAEVLGPKPKSVRRKLATMCHWVMLRKGHDAVP